GINVTGGPVASPATVFFSWSKSAIADGLEIPVSYSNFSTGDPNSYEVHLGYPLTGARSPVRLVHDPVLAVDSAAYHGVGPLRPRDSEGEGRAPRLPGGGVRRLFPEGPRVDDLLVRALAPPGTDLPAVRIARPRDPRPVLRLHSTALSAAWSHGPGDPVRQDPEGPV